eukprot:8092114-Ditylum_brightwellii.AAC.1
MLDTTPLSNWRLMVDLINQEAHWEAATLASANETAKTVVLNPVRTYALDKPEDLVQIDKAQTSIK